MCGSDGFVELVIGGLAWASDGGTTGSEGCCVCDSVFITVLDELRGGRVILTLKGFDGAGELPKLGTVWSGLLASFWEAAAGESGVVEAGGALVGTEPEGRGEGAIGVSVGSTRRRLFSLWGDTCMGEEGVGVELRDVACASCGVNKEPCFRHAASSFKPSLKHSRCSS